jgi:hypothetical protein
LVARRYAIARAQPLTTQAFTVALVRHDIARAVARNQATLQGILKAFQILGIIDPAVTVDVVRSLLPRRPEDVHRGVEAGSDYLKAAMTGVPGGRRGLPHEAPIWNEATMVRVLVDDIHYAVALVAHQAPECIAVTLRARGFAVETGIAIGDPDRAGSRLVTACRFPAHSTTTRF